MLIPGFSQPGVVFDAMLHVGTAGAVMVWNQDTPGIKGSAEAGDNFGLF